MKKSQATELVELSEHAGVYLFHDSAQVAYAQLDMGSHYEYWELRRKAFRRWLSRRFFAEHGKAPGSQAVQDALGVLEGKALFEGAERDVHVRIGHLDDKVYLDLVDERWRVVEVDSAGWRVIEQSPIPFKRPPGVARLPVPVVGGSLDELREFVNVTDDHWPLIATDMIHMFSRGPYPVLHFLGPQGAGKTTSARAVRETIDPNTSSVRAEPREVRDLMIAAQNSWIVSWDNLSRLPEWLSDAMCRLSTGGGFSTRELFSDADEVLFEARRPVIVNGIEELATRGDLLDRSLLAYVAAISDEERIPEDDFWQRYDLARPRILGALLDAVSGALRDRHTVDRRRLPRMADFAIWAIAAEPHAGLQQGAFRRAYDLNRYEASRVALEASQLADVLGKLLNHNGGRWEGRATDLLNDCAELADEKVQKLRDWPRSAVAMGNAISRLAPNLTAEGITVRRERRDSNRKRIIVLERQSEQEQVGQPLSSGVLPSADMDSEDGTDSQIPNRSNAQTELGTERVGASSQVPSSNFLRGEGD